MSGFTCIYLHGFLSSGQSVKGQWFSHTVASQVHHPQSDKSAHLPNKHRITQVITPTYPIVSPQHSVQAIEAILLPLLDKHDLVLLMGSSMGGFYAQFLGQKYQLPYIMINPALAPVPILAAEVGSHVNPVTGEAFCIDKDYCEALQHYDVAHLNPTINALLLVDEADEVIDVPHALSRYQALPTNRFKVKCYAGGHHAFAHIDQAWLEIEHFVAQLDKDV